MRLVLRPGSRRRKLLHRAAVLCATTLIGVACASNSTINEMRSEAALRDATTTAPQAEPDGSEAPQDGHEAARPPVTAPDPDPTPLPIDRDYRIGTLDNGLTYLLRSNDSPGSNLEIRLLVNAGSAQQADGSDGSAHFLEHMLFNGTEKYPGNELTAQLQRLGIEFGPEVNAYTSLDETVYILSAETADDGAVEAAFDVLAQWASAATLEPSAVEAEKGVVRDELRQRLESVDGIIANEFNKVYVAGTPYEGHLVIGEADKVEATTPDLLRSFYDDWYRPDNMAVVVVGDLPLDELEAKVTEYFSDLEARTDTPTPREAITVEISAQPQAHVVTHPDNSLDNLSLDYPIPAWDTGTVGGSRLVLAERAIAIMLTNRLNDAYQRGDLILEEPPFFGEFEVSRELRYFGTNLKAADLAVGLEDYMSYLLAAAGGFSEDDMERMRDTMIANFNQQLAGLNTTQDSQYANLLSRYWLGGADIDKAQTRIARQRTAVESFTAAELTNHWRWLLSISGPIVIAVGADESTLPTTDDLLDALANLMPAESGGGAGQIDELMTAPARAEPTDTTQRSTDHGEVTTWTFDNGVTVSHRHSRVVDNAFSLRAASAGGWSTFPQNHPGANAAIPGVAIDAVFSGGVGPHDALTLDRFLSTKTVGLVSFIDQSEEGFSAESATRDAEVLFQLLHLYITEPRVDVVAFRTAIDIAEQNLAVSQTHVDRRAITTLLDLIYDGDPSQHQAATQQQLDSLTEQTALEIYKARLGKVDDLAVAIVGDIERSTVADLAARYLGSLPVGEEDTWVDLGHELPTGQKTASVELGEGAADGGMFVFHARPTELTAETRVTANLLQGVINNRIIERIREELGASYGGSATISFRREPEPNIRSFISISGNPTRLDEIRSVLMEELEAITTRGVTADQFEQAHNIIRSDWNFFNNSGLANADLAAIRFPDEDRLTFDNRQDLLSAATRADVRALADHLYGTGYWLEVSKVLG
ncbi:MAG: insulinase family protein [Acidimicrobiaceae bacterium]|nr:insulinase family protein [Acidimicrobiaceae bacterium]MYG54651.1 insulinase family protein [Acidimicrobiaceae bacterium]MYJ98052.1 insulinase family protein [Acidimicrobiaceae bacterium]